jgi:hypothetical protein
MLSQSDSGGMVRLCPSDIERSSPFRMHVGLRLMVGLIRVAGWIIEH